MLVGYLVRFSPREDPVPRSYRLTAGYMIGIFLGHPVWGGKPALKWATVYFPEKDIRDVYLAAELEVVSESR